MIVAFPAALAGCKLHVINRRDLFYCFLQPTTIFYRENGLIQRLFALLACIRRRSTNRYAHGDNDIAVKLGGGVEEVLGYCRVAFRREGAAPEIPQRTCVAFAPPTPSFYSYRICSG